MKYYEKRYEDFYTKPNRVAKCDLSQITTDIGLDSSEYMELLKKNIFSFEKTVFDNMVKYIWLVRRFHYEGVKRDKTYKNGRRVDAAFGVFMRHYIGTDRASFGDRMFSRLVTYLYDIFPNFDVMNPFEEEMVYPYKNIGVSYLSFVYQMKERMELLAYAEEKKLRYSEFVDYVINYVYCYNEEMDVPDYIFVDRMPPYIRFNKEKYEVKRRKKRKKTKAGNIRKRKV